MIEDILKPGELEAIGQRLIKVREHLRLKQNRLAAEVGLSPSYLSDIEKGKSNPGFNFLMRNESIAILFEFPIIAAYKIYL
jgi:transcriptional regulator with XRE-family HTH domain